MQINIIKKRSFFRFTISEFFKNLMLAFLITLVFAFVFGYQYVVIHNSHSMSPTMPSGTLLVVKNTGYDSIKIGDVVMFTTGGSNVTHRVIGFEKGTGVVITAPDLVWQKNNQQGFGDEIVLSELEIGSSPDRVTESKYAGTVIYYFKNAGTFMSVISKTSNMIILFIGLVLIVFVANYM